MIQSVRHQTKCFNHILIVKIAERFLAAHLHSAGSPALKQEEEKEV
jgi:hypothetical protein